MKSIDDPQHCAEEQQTQHYLGNGHGHGPVQDDEIMLLAFFEKSSGQADGKVTQDAFPNKQLIRGEVSLARHTHTCATDFQQQVVQPLTSSLGQLTGVASAVTQAVRDLRFKVPNSNPG
jgi:hypothetical protein